jgi:hypothetical protein
MDPKDLIGRARHFFEIVPWFQNLSGPNFFSSGPGVRVVRHLPDGSDVDVSGPMEPGSEFSIANYWTKFESACERLIRVGETQNFQDMLTAVTTGLASADSFLIELATGWNDAHPERSLDLAEKTSFSERLDEWLPVILGRRLDKSGAAWAARERLRKVRNEWDQHDKATCRVYPTTLIIKWGNDFGPGIAEVLFDLHLIAGRRVPAKIVKFKYFPGFYQI